MNSKSECKEDGFSVSLRGEQKWPPSMYVVKVSGSPEVEVESVVEINNKNEKPH